MRILHSVLVTAIAISPVYSRDYVDTEHDETFQQLKRWVATASLVGSIDDVIDDNASLTLDMLVPPHPTSQPRNVATDYMASINREDMEDGYHIFRDEEF